jgi:hypothetical protein
MATLDAEFDLGDGNDFLNIKRSSFAANVTVNGDTGMDTFTLDRVDVTDTLAANMGDDDDTLTVTNSTADTANLDGGNGTNTLTNTDNTFVTENITNFV